jgi:hypothetical protein
MLCGSLCGGGAKYTYTFKDGRWSYEYIRKVGKLNGHLTPRWSARVEDKVPSSNRRSRGAQLNR